MYTIFGWVLIVGGIAGVILNLFYSECPGCSIYGRLYEIGFGIFPALIFVFSFFPGKFFLKVGDNKIKENKLITSSLVLVIIGIGLAILTLLIAFMSCPLVSCDLFSIAMIVLLGTVPAVIIYGVAVILLIINWFKNK